MARVLAFLARTPVLLLAGLAVLVTGAGFGVVQDMAGGDLLDMEFTASGAQAVLAAMDAAQRDAHLWITLILDTLYPLAYGSLLAGLAWRFAGTLRGWLCAPAIAGMLVDFVENGVQAIALAGAPGGLALKTLLTPLKFGLIGLAVLIAATLLVIAGLRRLAGRP